MNRQSRSLRPALAASILVFLASGVQADPTFDVLRSYFATDALPLDVQLAGKRDMAGAVQQNLVFKAFDNELVRARFERPVDAVNPPVVILLHGITQSLDQWWRTDEGPYSFPSAHRAALVDAGFAVFALDARNHGARISDTDFPNPMTYLENEYFEASRKMIAQTAL